MVRPVLYKVAGILGGITSSYLLCENKKKVSLSWTTNHSPSEKWDWNWDKRDPSSLVHPCDLNKSIDINNNIQKPSASRHLIFIRHGQYNLEGANDKDRYLTDTGRDQACLTGQRLKELSFNYSRFVYSTMTRARQTAEIILEKLDNIDSIDQDDLLREGAPIPPEPAIGSWKAEMHKFYTDSVRIETGFRKYVHRASTSQTTDSYEIFVCHANVIRYFVCRALQLPPEAWLRMSLHNGSITMLTLRPDGRVSLKLLGDCGFMPKKNLTFT